MNCLSARFDGVPHAGFRKLAFAQFLPGGVAHFFPCALQVRDLNAGRKFFVRLGKLRKLLVTPRGKLTNAVTDLTPLLQRKDGQVITLRDN
ncbi:hypothetical protein DHOM_05125 [Dermabacter hominis 1368]|uniref:Uncharacterized protein n=1 Tax=Dermabacter hominis 1368 TaxID=1450519 RepID=A0ABR4SP59_9MICO|nr:hypothetical protein DHOM_05125 [Dermabacter hominis 1368]